MWYILYIYFEFISRNEMHLDILYFKINLIHFVYLFLNLFLEIKCI